MKIVSLVFAATLAAVAGSAPALAQSSTNQSGNTPQAESETNAPTHPAANQWDRDRDWYQRPGYGYGWMGPGMMGPRAGWMMGPQMGWMRGQAGRQANRAARGARFTFTRGDARVDIQCPADQSLKDCVDAASTLIDKVTRMGPPPPPPGHGNQPPPPPPTPGSTSGSTGGDIPGNQ